MHLAWRNLHALDQTAATGTGQRHHCIQTGSQAALARQRASVLCQRQQLRQGARPGRYAAGQSLGRIRRAPNQPLRIVHGRAGRQSWPARQQLFQRKELGAASTAQLRMDDIHVLPERRVVCVPSTVCMLRRYPHIDACAAQRLHPRLRVVGNAVLQRRQRREQR